MRLRRSAADRVLGVLLLRERQEGVERDHHHDGTGDHAVGPSLQGTVHPSSSRIATSSRVAVTMRPPAARPYGALTTFIRRKDTPCRSPMQNFRSGCSRGCVWEPSIDAAHLGVAADDHVATLTGTVTSFYQKVTAARAAERVFGVEALANDMEVAFPDSLRLSDTDIATAARDRLHRSVSVPKAGNDITVDHGIVTLRGIVEWRYQRQAAEYAVRDLAGVVDVVNVIGVKPPPSKKLVKQQILSAFHRNAALDARRIEIETDGGAITLRGRVLSAQERREAERADWAAPGARDVENRLVARA